MNVSLFGYGSGYGVLPKFDGGVGVSCHQGIMEKLGLHMETITSTKTTDVYMIRKKEPGDKKEVSMVKSVGMVAALGNIMTNNKKDSNDWKLRMLKAGLENKGLSIPEDWDTLTEEEKEKRLNNVINVANGV